jgi:hypothetical protein
MSKTSIKPDFPLFKMYTVEDLNRQTGYSENHLLNVKLGWREANSSFRRKMSTILGVPEAELFGNVDKEETDDDSTDRRRGSDGAGLAGAGGGGAAGA